MTKNASQYIRTIDMTHVRRVNIYKQLAPCTCDSIFVAGTPKRDEFGRPLCIECGLPCPTLPATP